MNFFSPPNKLVFAGDFLCLLLLFPGRGMESSKSILAAFFLQVFLFRVVCMVRFVQVQGFVGSEDLLALPGFFVLPVIFLSAFSQSSFMLFRLDSYSSLLFVLFSLFALVPIAWFRVLWARKTFCIAGCFCSSLCLLFVFFFLSFSMFLFCPSMLLVATQYHG